MSSHADLDLTARRVIHTAAMEWQASPRPGVWRKRLEHIGEPEAGRVTSIVCYEPGSAFHRHPHPEGEEIFVLQGIFSDETGDYPAGSYLLNPEGFAHAPRSESGCVLFVKLRQYAGTTRQQVALNTTQMAWQPSAFPAVSLKLLYAQAGYPEQMRLERWQSGTSLTDHTDGQNAEILVLEGTLSDKEQDYPAGTWLRLPSGFRINLRSRLGCVLYVKISGR
jgi:anti-sigma factor ChrR (cupin superfamily)